ncbi:MAG: hypothetical protein ACREOK_05695 [Gemmatimonadaceae bacterium]
MLNVDKTLVAIDDSVLVTLIVTNASDRTVMVHPEDAYGPCLPGFEVTDEQGRDVQMLMACPAVLIAKVPLGPGEAQQITTWWHPDISRAANSGTNIPPGVYTIRGAVAADDEVIRSGGFEILVTE